METVNLIRLIIGCLFITLGIGGFLVEVLGVYRLKYVLDRMHFAGSGDTLAFAEIILGAVIINGFDFTSAKLVLVLIFFWFASPVSSHLISRLINYTEENKEEHFHVCSEEESRQLIDKNDGAIK